MPSSSKSRYRTANVFSRLFYLWIDDLIRLANNPETQRQGGLKETDAEEFIPEEYDARALHDQFNAYYTPGTSLFRALVRCHRKTLMVVSAHDWHAYMCTWHEHPRTALSTLHLAKLLNIEQNVPKVFEPVLYFCGCDTHVRFTQQGGVIAQRADVSPHPLHPLPPPSPHEPLTPHLPSLPLLLHSTLSWSLGSLGGASSPPSHSAPTSGGSPLPYTPPCGTASCWLQPWARARWRKPWSTTSSPGSGRC